MPKSDKQKMRILYVWDYLRKNSHANRAVTAPELAAMLEKHGIQSERKSIYSDIAALQDYGVDIERAVGRRGGFYMASQTFELPELKLLIDAVQSSRYLTEKKSRELIRKLCALCNEDDARLMRRDMLVSGRVKSMNETIYYSVDAIQEAMSQNRQITFRYFDWGMDGQPHYREKEYRASPYGMCQNNENCYLLAWSERHGVTAYRLDRMSNITVTEEPRIPCPELTGAAFAEYANRLFQMYSGELTQVKFRFHRDLVNAVIDRFGRDTLLIPDGEEHFVFTAPVAVSPLFLSWVMGFGQKAKILYPQSVVDAFTQLCREVLSQYSDGSSSEKE